MTGPVDDGKLMDGGPSGTSDVAAQALSPAERGWLRRDVVAVRLRISTRTVGRIEAAGGLQAERDADGTIWYEPASVERAARERLGRDDTMPEPEPLDEGELAAAVFAQLNQGRSPREVVVTLQLAPAVVKTLFAEWLGLEPGLWLGAAARTEIEKVLGGTATPEAIVTAVQLGVPLVRQTVRRCPTCSTLVRAAIGPWPSCSCAARPA